MNKKKNVIFIGGCPRSGTTMLGAMLGTADEAMTTPESHFKQTILLKSLINTEKGINSQKFVQTLKNSFRFKIWDIDIPSFNFPNHMKAADYQNFLYALVDTYSIKHNSQKWVTWIDHTPQNFQEGATLLKTFPNAKFIHIIRDPRAIFSSVINVDWGPVIAEETAIWWSHKISYALAFQHRYPDKCLLVRYEDIVQNTEESLVEICDFTGLHYRSEMILGQGFKLPKYTNLQHQLVGGAPDSSRLDKWKVNLDPQDIKKIENLLGDMMGLFGYEKTNIEVKPRSIKEKIEKKIKTKYLKWSKYLRFNKRKGSVENGN
ncbi:MAG: sulfotransferase [Candidatus Woykebacteria bacterium]